MKKQSTEIRQKQIKEAFLDIIHSDGLKSLSTRNLSKKIGLSEGSIFRHFASKQDIILAIFSDVDRDFIDSLRIIANSSESPEKRLSKLLCRTVTYLVDNKGVTMLLFSEASHNNDTELKTRLLHIFNSQKKLVSKIIHDGIAIGTWDESLHVDNIAMLYMGIPVTVNIELILNGGQFHSQNFCQQMMTLLERILNKENA